MHKCKVCMSLRRFVRIVCEEPDGTKTTIKTKARSNTLNPEYDQMIHQLEIVEA